MIKAFENKKELETIEKEIEEKEKELADAVSEIFNEKIKNTPKHIPNYLFNAIKNAKTEDERKQAEKELIAFKNQNPDYISADDRERLEQLGLRIPNQAEKGDIGKNNGIKRVISAIKNAIKTDVHTIK